MATSKRVVKVERDIEASFGTCMGAYRATLLWEGIKGRGNTHEEAIADLLDIAGRLGFPTDRQSYNILNPVIKNK